MICRRLTICCYYALLLLSTSGMMFMAKGTDLMTVFLGLETLSIPIYVFVGFHRQRMSSVEGAFKYFLLGAFASGFLLYGIALIYAATGTTKIASVASALLDGRVAGNPLLLAGAALVLVGFAFKVSLVPFHMWTPDAYEGAPTVVTAFMSAAVKAAAFAALIRVFLVALPGMQPVMWKVLWVLAVLTMTVGNLSALVQDNLKRMLAYSSIAHAGYILVGIVAANQTGSTGVLFYREGIGSTVKVFQDARGEKTLSIDGFPVAGTTIGMLDAQETLGNFAMLLSSAPSPRVNLIGFGAGGASWEALQYGADGVDCVELVPGVIEAAGWFPEVNHGVLNKPGYHLIMGDGRNYALVSDKTYDVISVDATSPKMAGNGSLYTREFFSLIADRLSEHGLAAQWLPFHLLSDAELKMTARTFMQVFPHTTLWLSPLKYHGLLVGSRTPMQIDMRELRRKLTRPEVARELARVGVVRPLDFLSGFVMGEDDLRSYVKGARLNTDNHPYLEFTPAWSYFLAQRYAMQNLTAFRAARRSVLPMLVNLGDTPEAAAATRDSVSRRFEATQHSFWGDILYALGKSDRAWSEWTAALSIDPSDSSATRGIRRATGR